MSARARLSSLLHWTRLSGWGLLAVASLLAALVGGSATYCWRVWQQYSLVATLVEMSADIEYEDGSFVPRVGDEGQSTLGSGGQTPSLLIDCFHYPIGIELMPYDDDLLTDDILRRVGTLSHLTHLRLSLCTVGRHLAFLHQLKQLKSLSIMCVDAPDLPNGCDRLWTAEQRAALASLNRLTSLGLKMNDADMVAIEGLSQLERLSLHGPRLFGTGLVHIRNLPHLKELSLVGSPIRDENLAFLRGLTSLKVLDLSHTPITGPGLVYLKDLALSHVQLANTKVDDDSLMLLKTIKSLRWVSVWGPRATAPGAARFRKARPDVTLTGPEMPSPKAKGSGSEKGVQEKG